MLKKLGEIEDTVTYGYFRGDDELMHQNFRVPEGENEITYVRSWFSAFFYGLGTHILNCEVVNG